MSVNKQYVNHATVAAYLGVIVEKMNKDHFNPDVVIGLSRGGLVPGVMLSHFLNKPFIPFQTALRDHPTWEINKKELSNIESAIVIDDICDTGETFKRLKTEINDEFSGLDLRFACLHYNQPCKFPIDWYGTFIDKVKQDEWVVYPWEDWHQRDAVENTIINNIMNGINNGRT